VFVLPQERHRQRELRAQRVHRVALSVGFRGGRNAFDHAKVFVYGFNAEEAVGAVHYTLIVQGPSVKVDFLVEN
jgi:hypothetical protein